ncbi:hypothetical protein GCM10010112_83040 [Actinoplanes lobatus]|uniref:Uncharacterized protein n=1 Tax=Actinoplanes lobatus TaxID=113568 RepID=A0A7W7MJI9_9ACTN|nr:hypothetical protein [Actinoplanes lobatus]MBB4752508.1 hypothetical protein [Actinoplanes lobatus]GGN94079.1 hypothetical protein GCM10010112_83040 [Actinoplanes lobatus]GIE44808.1 hypothetical protein Alo02nite_77060 [Actinoplanes lobatus]
MSDSGVRTVIVCMPADEPLDWYTASEALDWHNLPAGTPSPMFPVRRRWLTGWFSRWSARHLLEVIRRHGAVRYAAGGRKHRLDLKAAVTAANLAAIRRWRIWAQVVRGLPTARPWEHFLAVHQADPAKVTAEQARQRFEAQPQVQAMIAFSGHPRAQVDLDPYELGAYQAGQATYAALHWQAAVTGDMVITADGDLLEPSSPAVADRLRFMAEANRYLIGLGRGHQMLAVTITEP